MAAVSLGDSFNFGTAEMNSARSPVDFSPRGLVGDDGSPFSLNLASTKKLSEKRRVRMRALPFQSSHPGLEELALLAELQTMLCEFVIAVSVVRLVLDDVRVATPPKELPPRFPSKASGLVLLGLLGLKVLIVLIGENGSTSPSGVTCRFQPMRGDPAAISAGASQSGSAAMATFGTTPPDASGPSLSSETLPFSAGCPPRSSSRDAPTRCVGAGVANAVVDACRPKLVAMPRGDRGDLGCMAPADWRRTPPKFFDELDAFKL
mmetsp:Transcript_60390/g.168738  ORF Transcript_60390/g.168738 Transcript_60390/m.168738 type:complete len:263 (+) Transcript_60390:869-1657(+)